MYVTQCGKMRWMMKHVCYEAVLHLESDVAGKALAEHDQHFQGTGSGLLRKGTGLPRVPGEAGGMPSGWRLQEDEQGSRSDHGTILRGADSPEMTSSS